ncbi:hypothetical protein HYPSUDRAFT_46398 [Hypholoma sublateritium FD-334 SS-4]|uniref:Uncharacterized protein n=1 Tax=Hypholoma sublateritium (strain FD-334 SS-4) TaxID=945553 RepID=A0A0D2NLD3_HYPSF|nr:hypothetical protein HYPSUDRAFT_46398 [Hypholoma sublateritium FD-334 SS-4]
MASPSPQRPPLLRAATTPAAADVDRATIDSFPTPPSHTQNTTTPWLLRPLAHTQAKPQAPRPIAAVRSHTPPPLLLRKRHSAHALVAAGALTPPPTAELPPLPPNAHAHAARAAMRDPNAPPSPAISRPSSNSSIASSAGAHPHNQNGVPRKSAVGPGTPPPPAGSPAWLAAASQLSTSPSLPPYPHGDATRGPRKVASYSVMRPARARARPSTTEGVVSMAAVDFGAAAAGTHMDGGGARVTPWEPRRGAEPAPQAQGHAISRVSPAAPAVAQRSTITTANTLGQHSSNQGLTPATMYASQPRASPIPSTLVSLPPEDALSDAERATTPRPTLRPPAISARRAKAIEEVTPWEVQGGEAVPWESQIVDARSDNVKQEHDDDEVEYGVPRPMEFGRTASTGTTSSVGTIKTSVSSGYSSSVRSRASSTNTGPVEEVTPWEVQEIVGLARGGESAVDIIDGPKPASTKLGTSVRSRASSNARAATGPVEDVTPWEVQAPPSPSLYTAHTSPPTTPSLRTAASMLSLGSSVGLHSSSALALVGAGAGSVATGPIEEVTPWEVQAPDAAARQADAQGQGFGVPRAVPLDNAGYVGTVAQTASSVRSRSRRGLWRR